MRTPGDTATELHGTLLLPDGPRRGTLFFDRLLREVAVAGPPDPAMPLILPGFVDAHVHGGGGGDTMDGPDGVRRLARHHLERGTTTLLPTTVTAPFERVLAALRSVTEVRDEAGRAPAAVEEALPDLPGAHLEGPFLSPERLGAQPPHALEPTPERVEAVLATGAVRVVTLAPELPGAVSAARRFAAAGVRVSVGHTVADAEAVARLAAAVREAGGTLGFTHLFNAMGGLAGRAPGAVGAALADAAAWAELILDGHHVHATAFRAALAAKPERLLLVTDAIRACGLGDGPTELGGREVRVTNGAARLEDGTLAGSVLTLDRALRNAVAAGVPLALAARLASEVPAAYLGLRDRGRLEPGQRADLVVLTPELEPMEVWAAGRRVA